MKSKFKLNWKKNDLILKKFDANEPPPKFANNSHVQSGMILNWNTLFFGNNFQNEEPEVDDKDHKKNVEIISAVKAIGTTIESDLADTVSKCLVKYDEQMKALVDYQIKMEDKEKGYQEEIMKLNRIIENYQIREAAAKRKEGSK